MDQVMVLFLLLETVGFVPKMAGYPVGALVHPVVREYQVTRHDLEVPFLLLDQVPLLVLVLQPVQMIHELQVGFHLVVGCNSPTNNEINYVIVPFNSFFLGIFTNY